LVKFPTTGLRQRRDSVICRCPPCVPRTHR
jgi:hypothetical protein